MTTVSCPHCSYTLELPDDVAGKTVCCAKCQKAFTAPGGSGMASGAPPARPGKPDTGVTETAPSAKSSTTSASADTPLPRERRDAAEKSSMLLPIAIVAGVVVLGLCVCGAPVMLFLGGVSLFHAEHREVMMAEQAQADEAMVEVARAKEPEKQAPGFAKGAQDAKDAIALGKLLMKEYPPLPAPPWHNDYIKLLKEKCNCDYQVINAPKLPPDQVEEIRGWNDSVQAQLRGRHGPNIFDDLQKEADARWRERIKQKEKK